jgi:hypothetical protein
MSKPFHQLAHDVALRAPDSRETTIALRHLLQAKDAAVRAGLDQKKQAASAPATPEAS